MAGIQVSGLLSNSAFDWKSVVDQLIAADSIPINTLQKEQATNSDQVTALSDINNSLQDLQDAVQAIRTSDPFSNRTVSSDNASTTWKSSSAAGAPVGSYKFIVSQLATQSTYNGQANIGAGLSGATLADLNTAVAVKAGTFTVNGNQVTVATTDSLDDVFTKISDATGGEVTGLYDSTSDTVSLTYSTSDPTAKLVLGAANDTSNFLQAMKLSNGTGLTATSSGSLGTVKTSATLQNAGLTTPITSASSDGSAALWINNVQIDYNIQTDSLNAVLSRISASSAGVTARYDANADQVILTNKSTGDTGISIRETPGGLLGALGLTQGGAQFVAGKNAEFKIGDNGPLLTSASNTLDSSVTGISGLSVTVNTETTQTLTVDSDTNSMQTAIQNFLDKFNAVQDGIETKTKITIGGGTVSTSVLSGNMEVENWARNLQSLAFDSISGVAGSITHLDDLGIDFDGTTGHLVIKNQSKFSSALSDHPDDVRSFFNSGTAGMVPQMYDALTNLMEDDRNQQDDIGKANKGIDDQIATIQARLDQERETLTNAFIAMLDAQSTAQSQNTTLTNTFFKNNSSN